MSTETADNFSSLSNIDWQVHVYGSASVELTNYCPQRKLPLHVFAWQTDYAAAGLARDAIYLLRPDTYVALADGGGSPSAVERYLTERSIRPA